MKPNIIVVYEKDTKNILAVIPLTANKEALLRKDVSFRFFGNNEPVFQNIDGEIKFIENGFIVEL